MLWNEKKYLIIIIRKYFDLKQFASYNFCFSLMLSKFCLNKQKMEKREIFGFQTLQVQFWESKF